MTPSLTPCSRRRFLTDAPRFILLGALAALTGRLAGKLTTDGDGASESRARHRCVGNSHCVHCPAQPDCILPLAQSYRHRAPERTNARERA